MRRPVCVTPSDQERFQGVFLESYENARTRLGKGSGMLAQLRDLRDRIQVIATLY